MLVFWEHGYETTSLAELTRAMGITPPSLYAAFGDKERLFLEAVERYRETYGAYAARALDGAPTARVAVERLLLGAADAFGGEGRRPGGCLVITAATNCSAREAGVEQALRAIRRESEAVLRERIALDVERGRLPADTDPARLARLVATVVQGMSAQARDGATRAELEAVARDALRAWPGDAGTVRP